MVAMTDHQLDLPRTSTVENVAISRSSRKKEEKNTCKEFVEETAKFLVRGRTSPKEGSVGVGFDAHIQYY